MVKTEAGESRTDQIKSLGRDHGPSRWMGTELIYQTLQGSNRRFILSLDQKIVQKLLNRFFCLLDDSTKRDLSQENGKNT